MVTSKAGAYYALVSRLLMAGLPFESIVPGSDHRGCEVVLTTRDEASPFGLRALILEELDDDPGVFRGQVISKMGEKENTVFVGIDPGARTGMAVYYGRIPLAFGTFNSTRTLCKRLEAFARRLPETAMVVRVGNGNRAMAARLSEELDNAVPGAIVEIVDEKGTSARASKMKGIQGDQRAASRIAFRKGEIVSPGRPRTRE